MRSRLFGASATTNVPSGATENAVGSIIFPASAPIVTIFQTPSSCCVDAVDRVRTAIEDVELAECRLLEPDRLAEPAGDVGRNRGNRSKIDRAHVGVLMAVQRNAGAQDQQDNIPRPRSSAASAQYACGLADGVEDVGGLRQDRFFEVGIVRDRTFSAPTR